MIRAEGVKGTDVKTMWLSPRHAGGLRATVEQLAANPSIAQAVQHPEGCSLSFGVQGDLGQGHLDLVTPAGKIVCSSRKRPAGGYAGEPWLAAAGRRPVLRVPL